MFFAKTETNQNMYGDKTFKPIVLHFSRCVYKIVQILFIHCFLHKMLSILYIIYNLYNLTI